MRFSRMSRCLEPRRGAMLSTSPMFTYSINGTLSLGSLLSCACGAFKGHSILRGMRAQDEGSLRDACMVRLLSWPVVFNPFFYETVRSAIRTGGSIPMCSTDSSTLHRSTDPDRPVKLLLFIGTLCRVGTGIASGQPRGFESDDESLVSETTKERTWETSSAARAIPGAKRRTKTSRRRKRCVRKQLRNYTRARWTQLTSNGRTCVLSNQRTGWFRLSSSNEQDGAHASEKKGLSEAQTTFGFSRNFDKDFRLGKILGRGSFGTVYAVHPTGTSKYAGRNDLAVKVINKISFKNEKEVYWLKQEIEIMRRLSNSLNIVNLYDTYENPGRVYLLMEKCTGGTLYDRITRGKSYSESMARIVFGDIIRTVQQCHLRGVLHRDIKPENFLFASSAKTAPLKATDFGLACFCKPNEKLREVTGTPYFIGKFDL